MRGGESKVGKETKRDKGTEGGQEGKREIQGDWRKSNQEDGRDRRGKKARSRKERENKIGTD